MRNTTYLESAFNALIEDAIEPESWYVCLMENRSRYLGPYEGGTWVDDSFLVKYKEFPSEELANKAAEKIRELAEELSAEESRSYGEYCVRTMEWLEARGLDADFLPEPDGPTKYYVCVTDTIPENSIGATSYE